MEKNCEIVILIQQRLSSMLPDPAGSPTKTLRWWHEPSLALEGRELVLCGGGWLQLVSLRSPAPCLWLRSRLRQPWCWGLRAIKQHGAQQQTPYWSIIQPEERQKYFCAICWWDLGAEANTVVGLAPAMHHLWSYCCLRRIKTQRLGWKSWLRTCLTSQSPGHCEIKSDGWCDHLVCGWWRLPEPEAGEQLLAWISWLQAV